MKLGFHVFFLTIAFVFGVIEAQLNNSSDPDAAAKSSGTSQTEPPGVTDSSVSTDGATENGLNDSAASQADLQGRVLDSLVFEGLSIHPAEEVRRSLEVREGKVVNSTDIQESIRRLYSTGLFKSIDFYTVSETDSSVVLKIAVEEFPIFENVEYSGNKKIKVKDFEEKIKLRRGQVLTDDVIFDVQKQIRDMYGEKGYNLVEIKTDLKKSNIPGNALVKFNISEGPRVRVARITFNGNNEVKTSRLERKFKTKENRWWRSGEFNKDLYKEHLDTLILFYNDLGYLDASIVKDSVWYGDDKKDIFIDITINEGKKYYTGNFFFSGNQIMNSDSLQARISLKKGKPFQKSRFELSKYMIENEYREQGYLWVRVDDQRSFRGDTIDVNFDVYEGHPAIVRKIDIKGNSKTMEKVIRREIDLLPGKKYKQSLMLRSRQKINALNYFSEVKPDLVPNEDGTIDLIFEVTEKDNIGQLQLGAAYSGQSKFVGTFSTSIPNFRGAGQKLDVNLEIGKDKKLVNLGFSEPWAFDMPLALSGNIFYDKEILTTYDTVQSYGFVIGAGRSKLKWPDSNFKINGSYKLSFEQNSADGAYFPEQNLNILKEGRLNQLSLNIERYDLDMPLFPTKGDRLTITPRIAWGPSEKWFRFFKGEIDYEHYLPLPGKFVLGSRSKFGLITKLGKEIRIGKTDLFTAGGVYSDADNRGYDDFAFGGESNKPENSLALFATTLELRYPILDQQLYLALFADAANTWGSLSKVSLGDLYKSIGIGARINVPMLGIIGFDFGWGLDDVNKNWFKNEPNGFKFNFLMNRGF